MSCGWRTTISAPCSTGGPTTTKRLPRSRIHCAAARVEPRAGEHQRPVVEGLGEVHVDVVPVAGLATVGGAARPFAQHQRALQRVADALGRGQQPGAVRTAEHFGQRCSHWSRAASRCSAASAARRTASGRSAGPPVSCRSSCNNSDQRVQVRAAGHAAFLRAGVHLHHVIAGSSTVGCVGERDGASCGRSAAPTASMVSMLAPDAGWRPPSGRAPAACSLRRWRGRPSR